MTATRRCGAHPDLPVVFVFDAPMLARQRLAARLDVAELYPWPWLRRPHGGSATSYSAWVKGARRG